MRKFVVMGSLLLFAVGAQATVIATYDAGLGTTPEAQGWGHIETSIGPIAGTTNNMEAGYNDGGATVLYMKDQNTDGAYNLPSFFYDRSAAEDQDLFDNGMLLTIEAKNIGGWFIGFGFNGSVFETADNIGADQRIGANLNALPDDQYHTLVVEGGKSGLNDYTFTLSVDGGAPTPMGIQGNTSDIRIQEHLGFQSGSSGGTSAEAMFKSVVLESIPEPSTLLLLGMGGMVLLGVRSRKN